MGYYGKATASRIIKAQVLAWAGTGTSQSTTFATETNQVRVISQINGWISIDNSGTAITTASNAFTGGVYIAANTANGDYFTVTPGQILTFTSSTTGTTGSDIVSVAEMG